MKRVLAAAAAIALTVPAAPALSATTVTLQNFVGTWSSPVLDSAGVATIGGSGTTTPTIRWGVPLTPQGQSGYDFVASGIPVGASVPPTPSDPFELGTFTHLNNTINRPFLTSVVLTLTAEVLVDAVSQGTRNFVFNFTHTETPNGSNPCPFGGANGQGVNINGCADRVQVSIADSTESFEVDGQQLTLNIRGFQVDGNFVTQFLTVEGQNNDAILLADVTLRPINIPVPTPMSLALFATGLLGLGAVMRSRKA